MCDRCDMRILLTVDPFESSLHSELLDTFPDVVVSFDTFAWLVISIVMHFFVELLQVMMLAISELSDDTFVSFLVRVSSFDANKFQQSVIVLKPCIEVSIGTSRVAKIIELVNVFALSALRALSQKSVDHMEDAPSCCVGLLVILPFLNLL